MDGLLEQPKTHETDPISTKFPGVQVDSDEVYRKTTDQEVADDNTMAAGTSENAGIVNGTPHTDCMEGTSLPPLAACNDGNNIK